MNSSQTPLTTGSTTSRPAHAALTGGQIAGLVIGIMCTISLSGTIQALNLAFINSDIVELQCLYKDGTEAEKKEAGKILPLREKYTNYMVVAFILATTACDQGTVLMIERLTGGVAHGVMIAMALSTILITVFVNIVPEAMSFRFSSFFVNKLIFLTYLVMLVMFPIAFPFSLLMNCCIDGHSKIRNRKYLLAYIKTIMKETLEPFQVKTLKGTLTLENKNVKQIMTPIDKVLSLSEADVLHWERFVSILKTGFSRIPIHKSKNKQHIIGMLHIKEIAIMFGIKKNIKLPVKLIIEKAPRPLNFVSGDTLLNRDSFVKSLKSGMHLTFVVDDAVVTDQSKERVIGIVTLEDMIEEVIGSEITDESDQGKVNPKDQKKGMLYAKQLVKALEKDLHHHPGHQSPASPQNKSPKGKNKLTERKGHHSKATT